MSRERRFQYRLWWIMAVTVVVAAVIACMVSPLDNVALGFLLTLVFSFLSASIYFLMIVLPYFLWIQFRRCPACGTRMHCVVLKVFLPPLRSFHLCPGCWVRLKRMPLGGWRDASGAEDGRWFPGMPLLPSSPVKGCHEGEAGV